MIEGKRISIVGGAGFIGYNLALYLKKLGAEVSIIDSLQVNNYYTVLSNRDKVPYPKLSMAILEERQRLLKKNKIPLAIQDARAYDELTTTLSSFKPQIIIHLAAVSHANRSNKDPHSTFDHSLRTLENVLDYSRGNIEHLIYNSSSMVYGNFKNDYVNEETECNPIGIYGNLKFAGEKMINAYNQVFQLPYTIIRPSALYGRGCISRRVGQIFIEQALMNKELEINGDGAEKLDFTSIDDLLLGYRRIIENKESLNQVFNITYGEGRSILEMIEILKKEFPNLIIKHSERDKLVPKRGTLSVEKARKMIGYEAQYNLEKGYLEYINWYKNFFNDDYKNKDV